MFTVEAQCAQWHSELFCLTSHDFVHQLLLCSRRVCCESKSAKLIMSRTSPLSLRNFPSKRTLPLGSEGKKSALGQNAKNSELAHRASVMLPEIGSMKC
jgi:hypothetical protein